MNDELVILQGQLEAAKQSNTLFQADTELDEKLGRELLVDAQARTKVLQDAVQNTRAWQAAMLQAAQAQTLAMERQAAAMEAQHADPANISKRHAATWLMAEVIQTLGSAKAAGALVEEYLAELDRIAPE